MKKTVPFTLLSVALVSCASKPKVIAQNPDSKSTNTPSLTSPEVRRMWIPERIEGNKFIEGHYMYVIDKPSVWSR